MGRKGAPVVFADLPTSVLLTSKDREHISLIQQAGWAFNTISAIRFALKFTSDQVAKEKSA